MLKIDFRILFVRASRRRTSGWCRCWRRARTWRQKWWAKFHCLALL